MVTNKTLSNNLYMLYILYYLHTYTLSFLIRNYKSINNFDIKLIKKIKVSNSFYFFKFYYLLSISLMQF